MCRRILAVILLASFLLFSCKKTDVNANKNTEANNSSNDTVYNINKTELLQLVNDVRSKGCTCGTTAMPPVTPLAWNDQLAKAAYDHTIDMNANNYFSHTGLDGSDPGQRITAAGYLWNSWGENIASGFTTEQSVMNAWLASEGHCKNVMNGGFKDMGAGRVANLWTQDFGSK
jgi:uncharacterized protein YkwD